MENKEFLCFLDFSLNISKKPDFARVVSKSCASGQPEALKCEMMSCAGK